MGRNVTCGFPKVDYDGNKIPDGPMEFCMWSGDIVSEKSLDNFSFEKDHWMWVSQAFADLHVRYPNLTQKHPSQSPGFLDIGVNVGDWISPIRLLSPHVPLDGIEGSPTTAAIAAANLRTAVQYHRRHSGGATEEVPSKILPFALTNWARIKGIRDLGGVCFSKPEFISRANAVNIGGRRAGYHRHCRVADSAGATTLDHALQGLRSGNFCQESWPSICIAKIDVEGHEFKAISSVVSWLSEKPPCYVVIEYWRHNSYVALVELLLDVGYDALWRAKNGEYPQNSEPWWNLAGGSVLQFELKKLVGPAAYTELIFGMVDNDACVRRLLTQTD